MKILGIDIGGTKVGVAAVDGFGKILARRRFPMRNGSGGPLPPGAALDRIAGAVAEVLDEAGWSLGDVRRIGLAAPGPIDRSTGRILTPPNLPGWHDAPIVEMFAERFGRPVSMDNDANGGALAEWLFGCGRGCRHLIYLTMSTGIGGGIIVNGEIYRGANDGAGEIGHHVLDIDGPLCGCGQRGCFEAFCSGLNVARRLREILKDRPDEPMMRRVGGDLDALRFEVLREAAREGDPLACELWEEYTTRLAQGLGNLVNIFNPDVIALGTIVVHSGAFLMDRVRGKLPSFAWERPLSVCTIAPSELGSRIGDLGAAAIAVYDERTP